MVRVSSGPEFAVLFATCLLFVFFGIVFSEEEICPEEASVDLTHATRNASGFLATSGDFFPREKIGFRDGAWRGCLCNVKPCLPLCPPRAMTRTRRIYYPDEYVNYPAIPQVHTVNLTLDDDDDGGVRTPQQRFRVLVYDPCPGKITYFLDPENHAKDEFYLLGNGSLFLPRMSGEKRFLNLGKYCFRLRVNASTYTPRVCAPKIPPDSLRTANYIGVVVSLPFLVATVLVYSVVPELRSVHGTTLRCYLCCLIATYLALAIDRIPEPDVSAGVSCLVLGFSIYFSFLASFFWLNVMCIDLWWRFGGFGSLRGRGKDHDRKKFIAYSIYAWGSPVVLTAVCLGMEFAPGIPDSLTRPGFRSKACWFGTKNAAALYFFGPVGVSIACNVCLFVSTSVKIIRENKDTERQLNTGDSKRHDDNKQLFHVYMKLFVVMGITWSTEVISWLWEGPKYLWFVTDMVNALQGVLIFVIFVCKRRILRSLCKGRCGQLWVDRKGCNFLSRNSADSPVTSASLADSTPRCTVNVFTLEDRPVVGSR